MLAAAAPALADTNCELHLWPAPGLRSMYFGWFHGSTVDGAGKQRNGYPALPADPIPPTAQIELIGAKPVAAMLGLPGATLISHPAPLTRRQIAAPGRHGDSVAPCYAELIVDDIFHEDAALSTRSLRVLFRFATYGAAPDPLRRYTGWTMRTVSLPLPKTEAETAAAIAELRAAFAADFDEFAVNAAAKAHP